MAGAAVADDLAEQENLSAGGIAGEILDTAIDHCRRGERAQAMSMFVAIREQLSPPPALLQLVRDMEATGCVPRLDLLVRAAKLLIGGGYDSNVSQGITARSLTLGSGEDTLELPLDESYRPRGSSFAQFSADYAVPLDRPGWALVLSGGARANQRASEFNVVSAAASLSKLTSVNGKAFRVQGDWNELWLGGRHYQRVVGAGAQTVLGLDDQGAWVGQAAVSVVDYLNQPTLNSYSAEAGITRDLRLGPGRTVFAGTLLQFDGNRGSRPGGDRKGFQFTFGASAAAGDWRLKPQLLWQRWRSEDVFAAGLIDRPRSNRTLQFALQAERPLSDRQSLVLEWRSRSVTDTIPLYQYKSSSIAAFIQHQF
jgi:hypothetical protein